MALKVDSIYIGLFGENLHRFQLPTDYEPSRPDFMNVAQVYLTRGSLSTLERQQFVERICRFYPQAEVIECVDTPHNRIALNETDVFNLHQAGKKTLVFVW